MSSRLSTSAPGSEEWCREEWFWTTAGPHEGPNFSGVHTLPPNPYAIEGSGSEPLAQIASAQAHVLLQSSVAEYPGKGPSSLSLTQ